MAERKGRRVAKRKAAASPKRKPRPKSTPPAPAPANAGRKLDGRFAPGNSGNPKGKAPGTRHRATRLAQELLDGQAEGLVQKAVDLALLGDTEALRLCLGRLLPPVRERSIRFDLPEIGKIEDMPAALGMLVKAVSSGEVLPSEAERLASLFAVWCQALQDGELLRRVEEIEKARQRERKC